MVRTRIDLDQQTDLPITEAELESLGDNSVVDIHRHSKLVAPDGALDPALYIDNDGKTRSLRLPLETTLACNSNYDVGDLFLYYATGQDRYYLVYKNANGSAKGVLLGLDVTLT